MPPPATRPTKKKAWIRPSTAVSPADWTRLPDVSTATSMQPAPRPRITIASQGAGRACAKARISWPAVVTVAPSTSSIGEPTRAMTREACSAAGAPHSGGNRSSSPSVDSASP
jgi:hypothetical protein